MGQDRSQDTAAPVPSADRGPEIGPRWIDAHCHVQERYRDGSEPLQQTLAAAAAAGVVGLVCAGTDDETSRAALAMAHDAAELRGAVPIGDGPVVEIWATVGLHPHEADRGVEEVARLARSAVAAGQALVAIGECGLDYHYDHSDRAAQRRAFADQVALARELDLALVVHTREAWDDTIDILRAEGTPRHTVIHCFTGGPAEARRCLDLGAHLSFSGIVTFRTAQDVREAAALCPDDRLLVETDAPFLAPVPHRGKPNQPAWVAVVGAAVAAVRGRSVAELADRTAATTRRVFGLGG